MATNEVDEYIKRIVNHRGVVGVVIINADGIPIKSTIDNSTSVQYAGEIQIIIEKARTLIKEMDNTNDLSFLRLRTKKHEVLVAPDKDYAMIVIQNQADSQMH